MPNIKEILSKLTLQEKCALCSGVTNWKTTPIASQNVPSVMMTDGPHGMRKESAIIKVANVMQESEKATCFPPAVTIASSWDVNLAEKVALAIADEAKDQGVSTVLGPGVNIKRNPLCGRNFEYFSEDPYLTGEMAHSYISAMQSQNIGTSLKHFAVNSQEYRRHTVSSEVDERALREIYLPAFETAVKKAQPYTIMCSYNPINGINASDNKKLLTDILREEWGYKGIVVSDWGAVNDRILGIKAGMDLEMPTCNGYHDKMIEKAVTDGTLSVEELDKVVERMLNYIYKCDDNMKGHKGFKADYDKNFDVACRVASEGAVLLKNDSILPLSKEDKVAVIGNLAKEMRYQGSGSSRINPYKLCSFTDYLDSIEGKYSYADGYEASIDVPNSDLITEAVKVAKNADKVILFVGLTDEYESEGFDRKHLDMPKSHSDLINAVTEVNKNVIVVLSTGSPIKMPWLEKVKAVLNMYLCGEAGGKACYDLLFGNVNPSGKLAETYPLELSDNPSLKYFQQGPQTVEYRESIFVGYRFYDKAKKDVLFPFGFGLSYTTFKYSDLAIADKDYTDSDTIEVSFVVKNAGAVAGKEVAQVYVKDTESTIFREEKALKGFVKVELGAGESKTVSVKLDKRSFAFYNTCISDWSVESGEFEVLVGASSRDIRLSKTINIKADKVDIVDYRESAPSYYDLASLKDFADSEYDAVLGRKHQGNHKLKRGDITLNSVVEDLEFMYLGRFLTKIIKFVSKNFLSKGQPPYMRAMIENSAMVMPLRTVYTMTGGMVPKGVVDGLIKRFNGYPFQGFGKMIWAFVTKSSYKKSKEYPVEK